MKPRLLFALFGTMALGGMLYQLGLSAMYLFRANLLYSIILLLYFSAHYIAVRGFFSGKRRYRLFIILFYSVAICFHYAAAIGVAFQLLPIDPGFQAAQYFDWGHLLFLLSLPLLLIATLRLPWQRPVVE